MFVYLYEEFVVIECPDCGEEFILEWDEFEEMLEEEGLELEILDEYEDEEYCDCCDCEYCEFEEDFEVEDEIDEELVELMEEMRILREIGDYESYAVLAEAYATLFCLIYE